MNDSQQALLIDCIQITQTIMHAVDRSSVDSRSLGGLLDTLLDKLIKIGRLADKENDDQFRQILHQLETFVNLYTLVTFVHIIGGKS